MNEKIVAYYMASFIMREICKYNEMKLNDELINPEGMYLFKLYKKGKLSLDKVENFLKRLCMCIINDDSIINLKEVGRIDLKIMTYNVDKLIKQRINNKIYTTSLNYLASRSNRDSAYYRVYNFIKDKVQSYKNLNISRNDYKTI